jgi:antitoxin YefM
MGPETEDKACEEELGPLVETAYLLRAPANARRLLESLEQARRGECEGHSLR